MPTYAGDPLNANEVSGHIIAIYYAIAKECVETQNVDKNVLLNFRDLGHGFQTVR